LETNRNFLKDVIAKSCSNGLISKASIALIKHNEKELAFSSLKELWHNKNSESYIYRFHEGFKKLNNSDGVAFLKFAAQDSIICVSFDACVKLIEMGYKDYSKTIIEKHLKGKYSLISIDLLLRYYYNQETIALVTDHLNNSMDEELKYCGELLLKKYKFKIKDY